MQQHFLDVQTLHKAGIPLSPDELAAETGGQPEDFQGIQVVKPSPDLAGLSKKTEDRYIRMAGLSPDPDGGTIGFARMLEDVRELIARLKK